MTKAEVISAIAEQTGVDKADVSTTVEAFFTVVKGILETGDTVYVRGFGSFVNKERTKKVARNISKNTSVVVNAHQVPNFKKDELVKSQDLIAGRINKINSKKPKNVEVSYSFKPLNNKYILKPSDTWLITSFFDIKLDYQFISNEIVENLFKNASFQFYLDEKEEYVFTNNSEIIKNDFGKLHSISALDALKKYNLSKLEEAKEKGFVKVK